MSSIESGISAQNLAADPCAGWRLNSALNRFWGRLLIPSLSDLFFIAILLWLFVAGQGWTALLADADAGWHIRTGEYILQHHQVPREDLFSYSKPGAQWFAWEWLSDLIFAVVFRAAGLKGLVLLTGVVIACFGTLLLQSLVWRGANMFIALAVGLLSMGAASIHFLARPHVFTLLLLVISLWIIAEDRRVNSARVWWLVPLSVLWTNLHGGFVILILCLGLLAVGCGIEGWINPTDPERWSAFRRYSALTAATVAASLVNPYGYQLDIHIVEYLRSDWIRNVVQEFQAPTFRSENLRQFEILLFTGLIAAGLLFRRRLVAEGLWILALAHMALTSVRHVTIYVIVAAPLIASEATKWWDFAARKAAPRSLFTTFSQMTRDWSPAFRRTSILPVLAVAILIMIGRPAKWPTDFPDVIFPVGIVNRHSADLLHGRVFTEDQWGDYLIYRFYPRLRVFIDGRSDFYGPSLGNEYVQLIEGGYRWQSILVRHRVDVVLARVEWPLTQLLKQDPHWRVLDDDGRAILFVRWAATGTSGLNVQKTNVLRGFAASNSRPNENNRHGRT